MGQSLSKVYVHIIFSTKHRQNLIDDKIEIRLFEYIGGVCRAFECTPIRVGGYKNHIHVLCKLSKKITQAELVEQIKKRSSKWIKTQGEVYVNFYWQNGYAIFSVNPSKLDIVSNYITSQKRHHSTKSFKSEMTSIFNKYNMEYNDKYVWE